MASNTKSMSREQDMVTRGASTRKPSKAQRRCAERLLTRIAWFANDRSGAIGIMPKGFKLPGSQNRNKR